MKTLIFLHGLLGDKTDWQKLIEKLPHFRCISLDLPYHGSAQHKEIADFEQASAYIAEQIKSAVKNQPYFLVGYSLGGRLSLYYALQSRQDKSGLQGLILEGVNLGLTAPLEKQQRWQQDQYWARRFQSEPLEEVLQDWYQQPVFSHLNEQQRANLIHSRSQNNGIKIGKMLLATSLAKQPDFSEKVRSNFLPIYYFVGEKDDKFRQMAIKYQLNTMIIPQAGHNSHSENPSDFAESIKQLFSWL
ncbi:MAG: 2-succinyl-6-hydroxy-2,4-cyclohexadiene-1-carboxylate synthase [Lonepinella koalarum]|nr:2-succinyl-6-hydroxy-2,4-cyclohexadiene-1-carboxylate synthase [Lonepinella koalarum]